MNNTSSTEQKSKTRNLDANLELSQHKVALMSRLKKIKSNIPGLTQKQRAQKIGPSESTARR